MPKIKVNITIARYDMATGKTNRKKTSILIDKFLFDVVIFKLRRKKEYVTNKGDPKKKGRAKSYYQNEIMNKSDNHLMSNFLSHAIRCYMSYNDKEDRKMTEIANEILTKKIMSRTLTDEMK